MLILLPDFIGHPSCFRGLLARLGATDCRPVDYHRLDAYASIEALASQVLDGLAEEPDWLIGYPSAAWSATRWPASCRPAAC